MSINRRDLLRYTAYFAGAAVSGPVASALLSGCKRDAEVAAGEVGYRAEFFSAEEFDFVTRFADTLLPKTDTPGALDVGAHEMADKLIAAVWDEEEQARFRKGFAELLGRFEAEDAAGRFRDLEADQALIYLQDQDLHYRDNVDEYDEAADRAGNARTAYLDLKNLIVGNYFNSEEVATTMLAYLPVPGEYIPCGDLEELTGGRAWAI